MKAQADIKPFSSLEWMIALRYLRAKKGSKFISVIAGFSFVGILLGVATLIVVMSVMNGFRAELLDKVLGINGHYEIRGFSNSIKEYEPVTTRLKQVKGVSRVVPYVQGQVMVSSKTGSSGVLVRGLSGRDMKALTHVSQNLHGGSFDTFNEERGVAIGLGLALKLSLAVGDRLTLISPKGDVTPFGVTPRITSFPILAVFQIGEARFDGSMIYMNLKEAQEFFSQKEAVNTIEIMVDEPDSIERYRDAIIQATGAGLRVTSWKEKNGSLFSALQVERNVMFLILTLIVLVAGLNIISGIVMLVKDKSSQIAILRTMGAGRGTIMRIFFITGASIGFVGTLAGLLLGLVFAANIDAIMSGLSKLTGTNLFPSELYFLSHLPSKTDPVEVGTIVFMALMISMVATLLPSWQAAKLDPVEALRYE